MKKIALGADHAGYALKEEIKKALKEGGILVEDLGTRSTDPVDYTDIAQAVAEAVAAGRADGGVLVCGTGIGMGIAANKIPGVRAAVCHDDETARLAREHNDANVLCLGGRLHDAAMATRMVKAWLEATFAGGRHARRVEKIRALERCR
jgi:RpiB/LacA/LacB family sugar-phosphate isomerase